MLESQTLSIERIKLQEKINSERFTELRSVDPDFEARMGERRALQEQLSGLNEKLIQALEREDQEAQAAMASRADTSGWTAELREFRSVAQRTSLQDYFKATVTQRDVEGAAKEYNEHVFGTWHPGDYPLEMLLDRDEFYDFDPTGWQSVLDANKQEEERAVITGVAATHGNPTFVERLLANGEAAYLRASMPAVGPGRHSYPIVSGTTVASAIARDTAETPGGGLSIEDADPERIQHSYEYAVADELQIPGIANGLASDLRMSLMSGFDFKVVRDLMGDLTDEDVGAGATLTTAALVAGVHARVDGRAARYFNEIRLLAGNTSASGQTTAHARLGALMAAVTLDSLWTWFANIRASAHMFPPATGEDSIIAIRTGPAPPRLIAPVWRRGSLLRDPNTQQLKGHVVLTGVMYADVITVNSDIHSQMKVETQ